MDCKELKTAIVNKTLNDDLLILTYIDNPFVCNQYIDSICNFKNKIKYTVEDELTIKDALNGFEGLDPELLYVMYVDKLEKLPADRELLKNVVIVCKSTNEEHVEVPKLLDWQVIDYAKTLASGLTKEEIEWLCMICKYDIYRLTNELKKLKIFTPVNQEIIFKQMSEEDAYIDLQTEDIYVLVDAIIHKDIKTINSMLAEMPYIDIEGTGLVTMLRKRLLLILTVQLNPYVSAEELGITSGRLYYLKKDCGIYSNNQLRNNLEFLDQIDYKLKSGQLQFETFDSRWMNNMKLVDYILCNILK